MAKWDEAIYCGRTSGQRAMAELRAKGEEAIYAGSDETVFCGDEERNDRESLAEWPTAGLFLVIWGRDPTPKRSARLLVWGHSSRSPGRVMQSAGRE